tara:strand:+ start:602 stop:994 length:393 start_codon:yes stop_codon:yes gene_type:complete
MIERFEWFSHTSEHPDFDRFENSDDMMFLSVRGLGFTIANESEIRELIEYVGESWPHFYGYSHGETIYEEIHCAAWPEGERFPCENRVRRISLGEGFTFGDSVEWVCDCCETRHTLAPGMGKRPSIWRER